MLNTPLEEIALCIGIPTKNRSQQLEKCLTKLEVQTFNFFKVIVVDSSNDDKSKTVCSQHQSHFSDFLYIKDTTLGASAARNAIFRNCREEVLILVDDDVYLNETCLSQLLCFFSKLPNKENHLIAAAVRFPNYLSVPGKLDADGIGYPAQLISADYLWSALLLVPKNCLHITWNERFNGFEDIFFCLKCKKDGYKLAFLNSVLATHDKNYVNRSRASFMPEASQVYTTLYKYAIVTPSLLSIFTLETHGYLRNLLWHLQPYLKNPVKASRRFASFTSNWFKGHYWFLKDLRVLLLSEK